ncbi:MAG: hypothetical protein HQ579_05065 [Candidatus Omnitrophica bacterium]|nr:hypothetical protein [Candidatus Omnitrophota bacterium]
MKVNWYSNLKEAIESTTKEDGGYMFVRHSLEAGEEAKLHYHPEANEFLVVDNGVFGVALARKHQTFRPDGRVIVIHFPKKQKHSLRALAPTSYFVFRDKEDETIYCQEV